MTDSVQSVTRSSLQHSVRTLLYESFLEPVLRVVAVTKRAISANESSCNSLDFRYGLRRIHPHRPRPASAQQSLSDGRLPRSASRISPCHHVHCPQETPAACLDCTFHCTTPAELWHSARKPRLSS